MKLQIIDEDIAMTKLVAGLYRDLASPSLTMHNCVWYNSHPSAAPSSQEF